jgi:DHA1 family inner membrane transport protein
MPETTGTNQWPRIILIYCVGVFGMLVVSSALPALGGIAAEFHPPSASIIGWVMSAPALAAVLASLIIGWFVDRFGDRPVMLLGGLVVLAGDLGVIASHDLSALLVWRVLAGVGYVCMVVAAVTMISRLTQGPQRIAALALWSTVIPASFVVASAYGAMIGGAANWRFAFWSHGAGTAVLMVLAMALLPARKDGPSGISRIAGIRQVLTSPWPYLLGLSFAAAAFIQTGFVATLPRILSSSIGTTEAQVHSFNLLAMLCNIAGAFTFGILFRKGVRCRLIGIGSVVLCAIAGSGLILAPTSLMLAVAMNCVLMFGLGIMVGMWALLPIVTPSPGSTGATSGLLTQITVLGVLFGPPMAFKSLAGGTSGILLFLGLALCVCLIGWPVWRKAGHSAPSNTAAVGH